MIEVMMFRARLQYVGLAFGIICVLSGCSSKSNVCAVPVANTAFALSSAKGYVFSFVGAGAQSVSHQSTDGISWGSTANGLGSLAPSEASALGFLADGTAVLGGIKKNGSKLSWFAALSSNVGQSWTVTDSRDFDPAENPKVLGVHISGTRIISYGSAVSGSSPIGVIRNSSDSGISWSEFSRPSSTVGDLQSVTGVLISGSYTYAAGTAKDAQGKFHGIIVRTTDGSSWAQVADLRPSNLDTVLEGMSYGPSGALFAAGRVDVQASSPKGYVFKSTDGTSWMASNSVDLSSASAVVSASVFLTPANSMFAAYNSIGGYIALRRSDDSGASWSSVGNVTSPAGWILFSIQSDPSGNLFALSPAPAPSMGWEIQRSANGGSTWQTVSKQIVTDSTFNNSICDDVTIR